MALTQKQENFCLAYIETGNASEAYRRSYSAENMQPLTINKRASELMANGDIQGRIKMLNEAASNGAVMSRTEALEKLSVLARTDLKDLVEFGEYTVGTDPDTGDPVRTVLLCDTKLRASDFMLDGRYANIEFILPASFDYLLLDYRENAIGNAVLELANAEKLNGVITGKISSHPPGILGFRGKSSALKQFVRLASRPEIT